MSPRIVDKDEKRQGIALAAMEVFGEKGFDRTRMGDIAAKAGVGKGTLYEYFKNKEDLLSWTFDSMVSGMMDALMPEPGPERSVVEMLGEITAKTLEAFAQLSDSYRFFMEYMLHKSRKEGGYGKLSKMLEDYRQWLASLLDEGKRRGELKKEINSRDTAAAFAAWFDGAFLHFTTIPESVGLDQMGRSFLEMALGGLRAHEVVNEEESL